MNSRQNRKEGALKAKENKEKRTGVLRNVLILFCPGSNFQGSADQESYLRNENFSQLPVKACKLRVTTVVSGRSLKCNAIFAVWIFAVVDLFSRVDTSHFQYLGTLTTLFCTLKSDFLEVKSFEF